VALCSVPLHTRANTRLIVSHCLIVSVNILKIEGSIIHTEIEVVILIGIGAVV
jgi:hypothetical protein